ncbi:MAG: MFS transporter [Thermoguttaceae bacterium]
MAGRKLVPYKWELIILLWFAYCFNQADRQVYNVVLPLLQRELQLSDVQAGLVASIFMWTYAALVPIAGYIGDMFRRKWVVVCSLLVWSVATILSGASSGLIALVVCRSLATGGGEAFYYPSANSLIGQYHEKTRALAMSIHQTSVYVGIVASGLIAGWIADHYGWRMSFYVFGSIGVALAVLMLFRLKDVASPAGDRKEDVTPPWQVLKAVSRKPTFWALCLAFSGFNFAGWGYFTWMPTFLHEKYGLSLANAGFSSMFYSNLFAMVGVIIGGRLSDVLAARRSTIRMEFEYLGLLLGAPFIALMSLTGNLWLCYVGLAGFGLFRGVYDSNLFAALFDVIEPRYRASAVGAMLCISFVISAFAPVTLGWAKSTIGLTNGMALLSIVFGGSAVIIFAATKLFFAGDRIVEVEEAEA